MTRRFIVSEGLFQNTGQITNLPELIEIKNKYKYRLILDESLSFGAIGPRLRGVCDHFQVPAKNVEIIVGSLSNSLGSAGGFCVGDKNIVDHQVLSSQAYCYSASLPAFLAAAAIVNLHRLSQDGLQLAERLNANIAALRDAFKPYPDGMSLLGNASSPLLYLTFAEDSTVDFETQKQTLNEICKELKKQDYLVTLKKTVESDEKMKQQPMLKIVLSAGHTTEQVSAFAAALRRAAIKHA